MKKPESMPNFPVVKVQLESNRTVLLKALLILLPCDPTDIRTFKVNQSPWPQLRQGLHHNITMQTRQARGDYNSHFSVGLEGQASSPSYCGADPDHKVTACLGFYHLEDSLGNVLRLCLERKNTGWGRSKAQWSSPRLACPMP